MITGSLRKRSDLAAFRNEPAIIDGGACGMEPTSIIDFSRGDIAVLRKGKGDTSAFEA